MTKVLVNSPRVRGRKRMATRKKYDSQKKWNVEYQKERTKQIGIRFFPADMELYDFVKSHDNINGYIKDLIRADMNKQQ